MTINKEIKQTTSIKYFQSEEFAEELLNSFSIETKKAVKDISYIKEEQMTNLYELKFPLENFEVTSDFIDLIQSISERINDYIDTLARKIYYMRHGQELDTYYDFDGFEFIKFSSITYWSENDRKYSDFGDPDTPIVNVKYYDFQTTNEKNIIFHQYYLGIDWTSIEKSRIDDINKKILKEKKKEEHLRLNEESLREYKEYERLKTKFEGK